MTASEGKNVSLSKWNIRYVHNVLAILAMVVCMWCLNIELHGCCMVLPKVLGCKLTGDIGSLATSTDVFLTIPKVTGTSHMTTVHKH